MPEKNVRSISTTLSYADVRSKQVFTLVCKKCRTKLDISQPNSHRPYQYLGVCADCDAWYRIETKPGDPRGVIVDLPEITRLLPAHEEVLATTISS